MPFYRSRTELKRAKILMPVIFPAIPLLES
jgi:hypothetical protein